MESIDPVNAPDPFARLPAPRLPALPELPPPDPGPVAPPLVNEVALAFPPEAARVPAPRIALPVPEIVRVSPEGSAGTEGTVTVVFSQPMIPLASVGQVNAGPSPLVLAPPAAGKARWIDPRTFALEAAGRFRYSTTYRASVAGGLAAADGQALAQGREWSFSTELAQRLAESRPWNAQGGLDLHPLIQLRFTGAMEAGLAAEGIRLEEKATHRAVPIEVLPGVPPQGARLVETWWDADKSLAVRPREALRPATRYRLVLEATLASPEGPNTAAQPQVIEFETYAKFALQAIDCPERRPGECQPGATVWARFNNPFAPGQKLAGFASVTPAPANLQIIDHGSAISFEGTFAPSTAYTFTVKPGLRDAFGQALAKGASRTLKFGALEPRLRLEGAGSIVVVESEVSRKLGVDSVNLAEFTVRSALVGPESLARAERWVERWSSEAKDPLSQLPEASRRVVRPGGAQNQPVHTELDLLALLGGARFGAAIVEITSAAQERGSDHTLRALVQVTDLSALALLSPERLHLAVSRFSTGESVAGARVIVHGAKGEKVLEGITDTEGRLSLGGPRELRDARLPWTVLVSSGEDRVLLPLRQGPVGNGLSLFSSSAYLQTPAPSLVATAFTDRGIYRPGETAQAVLVTRQQSHGTRGDLIPLPPEAFTWSLHGPRGEVAKGEVLTDAFGFASVALKLDGPNLGHHQVTFSRKAGDHGGSNVSFRVEEYRPPEFLAGAAIDAPSPVYLRGEAGAHVTGRYLFGAPMAGAAVHWQVTRLPADYAPPNWDTFTFRRIERWRWHGEEMGRGPRGRPFHDQGVQVAAGDGALDGAGALALKFPLDAAGAMQAQRFSLGATVTDKNRQAAGAGASLLAHPSGAVVGLRLATTVVPVGGKVEAELIVTDLDGKPLAERPISLSLAHEAWGGGEAEPPVAAQVQSGTAPVKAALVPTKAGAWTLTAVVHDPSGGAHLASIPVWIVGPDFKQDGQPQLQVILDKTSYAPGETVRALVLSPFPRSRGTWALAREGFLEVRPLVLTGSSALLEFRADDAWVPNAELVIALAQPRVKPPGLHDDDGRPKLVTASKTIPVDKRLRTLAVQVTPAAPIAAPATEATLRLEVRDAAGRGRATQVTVMVVDEGVLAMTGYLTPRLIDALYPARVAGIGGTSTAERVLAREPRDFAAELQQEAESRSMDRMGGPMKMMLAAPAPAMKESAEAPADLGSGEQAPEFAVRQNFSSAPWFKADVRTGPDGRAEVKFKLPDNLTEFRVMAVAADEARAFGAGESRIVVRRPVLVRPSLPRFLNVGDRFQAAATVHNETGEEADLEVICRAANARVPEPRQRLHLKAGESREVRFQAEAGAPGPAKFQFAAVALTAARPTDAAEVTIPTRIPATAEAFASYGQTEGAARLAVELPGDALPGYGGLELQLSSTALTGLSDAIDYLVDYPFGCAEQTASRILPLASLKDVLVSLKLASVANEQRRAALLDEAVRHLLTLQRDDGGFGLWSSSQRSGLWLTAYATYALDLALRAGAAMPEDAAGKLANAVRWLGGRLEQPQSKEWDDGDESRSLAALVLARRGETPARELRRLIKKADLPLFAVAWTMQAAALGKLAEVEEEGHRRINNAAVESAGTIHFAERASESLRLLMHSDDRTDGIVLGALLTARPQDPMVDKTVRGLMRLRAKGRWSTTQSNAWALIALSDYFKIYQAETPDFLARLWFGEGLIAAQPFKGRSTGVVRGTIPFAKLGAQKGDLVIAKQGPGRLYYRVGLRYAPASVALKALDQGFIVSRTYEGLKSPSDVTRLPDGTWRVKAGATVRVRLKVTSPDRRYYAAIVDPLPAGFEILDTSLATSAREEDPNATGDRPWWAWWSPWSHTELKDDRLQLFADALWAGDYQHSYLVRATTPGRFVAPPPRAEEMYAPETFGRGQSDVVEVE